MIDIDITAGIGFATLLSAIVQLFIKPGLRAYYGGEDQAKASPRYPFIVNLLTFASAKVIAMAVLYVQATPADSAAWVSLLLSSLAISVMGTLGSIGVESIASNVKKVIVN